MRRVLEILMSNPHFGQESSQQMIVIVNKK